MTRRRSLATLAVVSVLAAGCAAAPSAAPGAAGPAGRAVASATATATATAPATTRTTATSAATGNGLCGSASTRTPPRVYRHVIWIWFENHSYGDIIGARGSAAAARAPYTNAVARKCGLATNYHNITHPSLPNYLAAVSGTTGGVRSDCWAKACPQRVPTIFSQLRSAGRQWRAYQEDMPTNCRITDAGAYAARHNPPVYYPRLSTDCARWDVPFGAGTSGHLRDHLASGRLARFSFITPNLCHDTHDCSVTVGDTWLSIWLPRIVASPAYQSSSTAVFITWDEGEHGTSDACALNTSDVGCHIATLVLSRWTRPGSRSATLLNHYALLRTTEDLLGLAHLAHARDATSRSMRAPFHL